MSLNYSFAGRRVLITGGGSGIGRQLVHRFITDGAIVFTIDKNAENLKKLEEELPNGNLTTVACDISDWEATKKIVEGFGVIDHLVNNAGIAGASSFMELTEESLLNIYKVNLFAIVNVSQVVAKALIKEKRPGTIVNIASILSKLAIPCVTAYSSTKAAVVNLTKSMAIELGAHNIRVNSVLPGFVDTPLYETVPPEVNEVAGAYLTRCLAKRMIQPDEIADLVLFLLSPLSTMVIGEAAVIDGGVTIS